VAYCKFLEIYSGPKFTTKPLIQTCSTSGVCPYLDLINILSYCSRCARPIVGLSHQLRSSVSAQV
jgi:hypothetical protein